jgi:methylthioribose-1-phosphate isomerase
MFFRVGARGGEEGAGGLFHANSSPESIKYCHCEKAGGCIAAIRLRMTCSDANNHGIVAAFGLPIKA